MKTLVTACAIGLVTLFTACSKNDQPTELKLEESEPLVSFKHSDQFYYEVPGDLDYKNDLDSGAVLIKDTMRTGNDNSIIHPLYRFAVRDGLGNYVSLFTSPTEKLELKTYQCTYQSTIRDGGYYSTVDITIPGVSDRQTFIMSGANDVVSLTITKLHDGLADGTFSGRLTNRFPNILFNEIFLTEGKFQNIKVIK